MKVTITRLLETSKLLSTKVGQEIPDFLNYMGEFVEQVIRALRNGLSFADNHDCAIKTVGLRHNVAQVIEVPKTVSGILPTRVVSQTALLRDFGWYYDNQGRLTVKAGFDSDPGSSVDVVLVVLF